MSFPCILATRRLTTDTKHVLPRITRQRVPESPGILARCHATPPTYLFTLTLRSLRDREIVLIANF